MATKSAKKKVAKVSKPKKPLKAVAGTRAKAKQPPVVGEAGTGEQRFAGYPAAVLYDKVGTGRKALKQLLWGDWIRVIGGSEGEGFVKVHARGVDGVLKKSEIISERLLEVNFVDIGQGDGCLLVTPDDQHIIIDAGAGDNMVRFLRWRYGGFKKDFTFEAAVLSHSDLDHYGGFRNLFDQDNVRFKAVYTNGLMERESKDDNGVLGELKTGGGVSYIDALVPNMAALKNFLANNAQVGKKQYPLMFKKALAAGKIDEYRQLSVADEHVPGFGPDKPVTLQILGPVVESFGGSPALRWFGDTGKTKNGHSVVLRLVYDKVSLLLGGDLNIPAEGLLLKHHAKANNFPESEAEREKLSIEARKVF